MHFLQTLILQLAVILLAARVVGWLFRRIHQPQVVGEIAAGIILGPSLLGWVAPELSAVLFAPESLGFLNTLSQVGLILFMFLVGLEFDPRLMRGRGHAAVVTSHVSIIAPFFLGAVLAMYLYPRLSDAGVSFTGFALFLGAAMSITAFPVLARILTERNLLRTRVGAVTIACAAVDDVTAWSILAVVVVIVRAGAAETPLWITLAGSAMYILLMVYGVRRALGPVEQLYHDRGRLTQDMFAGVLLLLFASAWTTEWLGIHALFGAFAMGAVMPNDRGFVHDLSEKLEDVTVVFLLPIFFAFTGLQTSFGLVSGVEMWGYMGLILLVAVAGKFGGSTIAARITALSWREASALGILMNTRGLMELVILTIGLELGVISPALFTMMVLMALITTFMTTPVLEWLYPLRRIREVGLEADVEAEDFTVLVAVSLPSSGPGLLQAARLVAPPDRAIRVYALHLERSSDQSLTRMDPYQRPGDDEVLQPLLVSAEERLEVRPLSFTSGDIAGDIVDVAHVKGAELVVMGWHKPILSGSILSGTASVVLRHARADVAVLVERAPAPWRRILVPYRDVHMDRAALGFARRIAANGQAEVTILHVIEPHGSRAADSSSTRLRDDVSFPDGARLKLVESDRPLEAAVRELQEGYDLVVVGVSRDWGTVPHPFSSRHQVLARASASSLLVVRPCDARDAEARTAAAPARDPRSAVAALR